MRCLICKTLFQECHWFYQKLCLNCGESNYCKRQQTANLKGKYALVTGGRIRIGYGVALKLLREGATVIVTTRFPNHTAQKYAQEEDFSQWQHRLQIYGLDLRNLAIIEQFTQHLCDRYPQLDIIINNAAQTVRRPPAFYRHLIEFESLPVSELPKQLQPLVSDVYRLERLGQEKNSLQPLSLKNLPNVAALSQIASIAGDECHDETLFPTGKLTEEGEQLDLRSFNSWLLKDDQTSILEVLEVHVINAIAPFILNSRLKRLMRQHPEQNKFIINVSSKEGQFNGGDKPWRHPHTNMAKAALNQMTRTCAKEYAKHRIFMNAVDPGWISFQHPYSMAKTMQERGDLPPFDVIDAAARICDPIYLGLNEQCYLFGKLFKDYQEIAW
jgi:NAD(P)-dependent dehydrogenase (short-subunit alcohol dehydrogenase family)